MNKKKLLAILTAVSIFVVVLSLTIGTFAFFKYSKTEDASLTTGTVDVNIVSESYTGDVDNTTGIVSENKVFKINSLGSKRTYARVFIMPTVEYFNRDKGTWDTCGFISSDNITYSVSGSDWAYKDGYYYYNKIMSTNDETTNIEISNIKVTQTELDRYPDFIYRVVFSVNAEGCQASHDAYKLTWGNDCVLPESVESYSGTDVEISD